MTTSTVDVGALATRLLDRLRSTSTGRGEQHTTSAYAEALRIAELLVSQPELAASSPAEYAEVLRSAAITLAATRHSLAANRRAGHAESSESARTMAHIGDVAESLVAMADVLDARPAGPVARVSSLVARRHRRRR